MNTLKPGRIKNHQFGAAALLAALTLTASPTTAFAEGHNNGRLTIYFTRHAEKETITTDVTDTAGQPSLYMFDSDRLFSEVEGDSPKGKRLDEVCGVGKCGEQLSKLGALRASLLAEWFERHGITAELDAVYATHKIRTQQTVTPTAITADLDVVQFPAFADDGQIATELNPESTTDSECPTIMAIRDAQAAGMDTILVAGHSGTLYDIMGDGNSECDGLGLDTTDGERFPKDPDDNTKVRDFGDIWKVVLRPNREAKFRFRANLQPPRLTVDNITR